MAEFCSLHVNLYLLFPTKYYLEQVQELYQLTQSIMKTEIVNKSAVIYLYLFIVILCSQIIHDIM